MAEQAAGARPLSAALLRSCRQLRKLIDCAWLHPWVAGVATAFTFAEEMDGTLEPLWKSGEKPFHGETLYPLADVFVRDAIIAIPSALDHIAQYYSGNQLFVFEDWHEHDGFIVPTKAATLEELRRQVATPESYVSSHSDDTAVYRAIYPDSRDFLLRYCLWDADDPSQEAADREVHWTFTGFGHDLSEMTKRWAPYNLARDASARYYLDRYAG